MHRRRPGHRRRARTRLTASVLAADLGGASLRVARIARDGSVLATDAVAHAIGPEADAEAWWRDLVRLIGAVGTEGVRGICVGGFTRSQVLIDAAGAVIGPALCFPDTRGIQVPGAEAGTWMAMTPFHPVARLRFLADAGRLARARHVLQPAEFLAFRLTGIAAAERVSNPWAIRRDDGAATTAPLAHAGLDPGLLPPLRPAGTLLGPATLPALAGIPVFLGAMDTWMACLGAGVGLGEGYLIAGTTDAGGVLTATPADLPGLSTLPWGDGLFHSGGPSAAGGACLAWAARLLGLPGPAEVVRLAAAAGPDPPLFVPALMGSRAPDWRAEARGLLHGLTADHGPADIARAVLEGIALAGRDLLGGLPVSRVVLAGGGAREDAACQLRADVLGRPVARVAGEAGLAGAAMLAWTGLGAYPSIGAAQRSMARVDRVFTPAPGTGYDARHAAFRALAPLA